MHRPDRQIAERLYPRYQDREAQGIAIILLEEIAHLPYHRLLMGDTITFDDDTKRQLNDAIARLAEGEPLQYILGKAFFMGEHYVVTPATLIPRPETEELVEHTLTLATTAAQEHTTHPRRWLDIGTGSGCIACSLARRLRQWHGHAIDLSPDALAIAQANHRAIEARHAERPTIAFHSADLFAPPSTWHATAFAKPFDLIVSNPPYIRQMERTSMEQHVLDHEPSLALFVPDNDPLRYYRRIVELAPTLLSPGGLLCLEINSHLGSETIALFPPNTFTHTTLHQDLAGRDRIITTHYTPPINR